MKLADIASFGCRVVVIWQWNEPKYQCPDNI